MSVVNKLNWVRNSWNERIGRLVKIGIPMNLCARILLYLWDSLIELFIVRR